MFLIKKFNSVFSELENLNEDRCRTLDWVNVRTKAFNYLIDKIYLNDGDLDQFIRRVVKAQIMAYIAQETYRLKYADRYEQRRGRSYKRVGRLIQR